MEHDAGVLKIHALCEQIGREQQRYALSLIRTPRSLLNGRHSLEKLTPRNGPGRNARRASREKADSVEITKRCIMRRDRAGKAAEGQHGDIRIRLYERADRVAACDIEVEELAQSRRKSSKGFQLSRDALTEFTASPSIHRIIDQERREAELDVAIDSGPRPHLALRWQTVLGKPLLDGGRYAPTSTNAVAERGSARCPRANEREGAQHVGGATIAQGGRCRQAQNGNQHLAVRGVDLQAFGDRDDRHRSTRRLGAAKHETGETCLVHLKRGLAKEKGHLCSEISRAILDGCGGLE